jgi:hypothetical protein
MHAVRTNQSNCQSSLPSEASDSNSFPFWHPTVSHHRLARTSADILCVQDSNISDFNRYHWSRDDLPAALFSCDDLLQQ